MAIVYTRFRQQRPDFFCTAPHVSALFLLITSIFCLPSCESKKQNVVYFTAGSEKSAAVDPRFLPDLHESDAQPGDAAAARLNSQIYMATIGPRDSGGLAVPVITHRSGHIFPLSDSNDPQYVKLIADSLDASSVPAQLVVVFLDEPARQKFSLVVLPSACLDGSPAPAASFDSSHPFSIVYCSPDHGLRIAYVPPQTISDIGAKLGFKDLLAGINQNLR